MGMRIGTEMPQLDGATGWINKPGPDAAEEVKGHTTLVHFWSVSCHICKENMPRVSEWREKRREEGLRVIAIHMPRYPADMDESVVREAIEKFNITEACAVDNDHKLRDAFKNDQGFVPAYYLFDTEGKLRCFAAGERGLAMLGPALERVLAAATKEAASAGLS
ncbi:MAG TPA: redoxin domain-containing protein, partial [Pyrinomonadaceae bacterium]